MTHPAAPTRVPGPGDTLPEEGVALIRQRCDVVPSVALVLGSGLGEALEADVVACHEFAYEALPGFPPPSVPGHLGRLRLGELYEVPVAVFLGRVHLYEGHGVAATTLVTRLSAALGARTLVVTNAAGGLRAGQRPGSLMLIRDHLNMLGVNPLAGWRLPDGSPAFVDMSRVYDEALGRAAEEVANQAGLEVTSGVYTAVPGPSYETPAEIRFLAESGADAVGMSTVPEAAAAAALGLRVLGISCITNVAGGEATHEGVLDVARRAGEHLRTLLRGMFQELGVPPSLDGGPTTTPSTGGEDTWTAT